MAGELLGIVGTGRMGGPTGGRLLDAGYRLVISDTSDAAAAPLVARKAQRKDVRPCVDKAEAMGVPMVVGAAVRQMLAVTQAKFGPQSDFTSIAKVVEEWAGVEIREHTS